MRLGHSPSFPQGRSGMWKPEPRILSFSQTQHSIPYQVQQDCAGCFYLGSKLSPLPVDVHDDMSPKAAAGRCPGKRWLLTRSRVSTLPQVLLQPLTLCLQQIHLGLQLHPPDTQVIDDPPQLPL